MTLKIILFLLNLILITMALRGSRRAYIALLLLAIFYFPLSVGFALKPGIIDAEINWDLILLSLQNYRHIILFALFYIMTCNQLGDLNWKKLLLAGAITMTMGVYVEFAQWYTGNGHCRVRDLIPDAAGTFIGLVIQLIRIRRLRKGYQQIPA